MINYVVLDFAGCVWFNKKGCSALSQDQDCEYNTIEYNSIKPSLIKQTNNQISESFHKNIY